MYNAHSIFCRMYSVVNIEVDALTCLNIFLFFMDQIHCIFSKKKITFKYKIKTSLKILVYFRDMGDRVFSKILSVFAPCISSHFGLCFHSFTQTRCVIHSYSLLPLGQSVLLMLESP